MKITNHLDLIICILKRIEKLLLILKQKRHNNILNYIIFFKKKIKQ